MKIHGMRRMLGALLSVAIVISNFIFPALAQAAPAHYSDDAIVRDLKAGKLTVREAQMLQARRAPAVVSPARAPKVSKAVHVRPGKPVVRHKTVQHKAAQHKIRQHAPVRHLTSPRPKAGVKSHTRPTAGAGHKAMHGKHANAHMKTVKVAGNDANMAGGVSASGPHRAIKYIR